MTLEFKIHDGAERLWLDGGDVAIRCRHNPKTIIILRPRTLNRDDVADLISHLQSWLDTGSMELANK